MILSSFFLTIILFSSYSSAFHPNINTPKKAFHTQQQQQQQRWSTSPTNNNPELEFELLGNNDDDDDDEDCSVPKFRSVTVLSDSTGVTAKEALARVFTQFDPCCPDDQQQQQLNDDDANMVADCRVKTEIFSHVKDEEKVASVIRSVSKENERRNGDGGAGTSIIVFTLSNTELRAKTARMCQLSNLMYVDLLGPLIDSMSVFFEQAPLGLPPTTRDENDIMIKDGKGGRRRRRGISLGNSYYRRIEAVEFTLKADDGSSPWLLPEADVVLVGVSRTGKTPLSVVMAQTMALKVANVPLVRECAPPKELLSSTGEVDPSRVVCLTIHPNELKRLRASRLKRTKVKEMEEKEERYSSSRDWRTTNNEREKKSTSDYADRDYIMKDLKYARDLALENNWSQVDVTGRAVEETASLISEKLNLSYKEL